VSKVLYNSQVEACFIRRFIIISSIKAKFFVIHDHGCNIFKLIFFFRFFKSIYNFFFNLFCKFQVLYHHVHKLAIVLTTKKNTKCKSYHIYLTWSQIDNSWCTYHFCRRWFHGNIWPTQYLSLIFLWTF
jgi:hypothetical protein